MKALIEKIRHEAVHVGGGIIKVDSFINHQVDALLMQQIGETFAHRFGAQGVGSITKILTAEISGILPALMTARALAIPMIYARKQTSAAMTDQYYQAQAVSRTKGGAVTLRVSKSYLGDQDSVLLIDDFLATGSTLEGLIDIVKQSGANLCGIGCIIEKPAEGGRERLAYINKPVLSLAKISFSGDGFEVGA